MDVIAKLQVVNSGIRMENALTGTRRLYCWKYGRLKQCNVLLYENKPNDKTLHSSSGNPDMLDQCKHHASIL